MEGKCPRALEGAGWQGTVWRSSSRRHPCPRRGACMRAGLPGSLRPLPRRLGHFGLVTPAVRVVMATTSWRLGRYRQAKPAFKGGGCWIHVALRGEERDLSVAIAPWVRLRDTRGLWSATPERSMRQYSAQQACSHFAAGMPQQGPDSRGTCMHAPDRVHNLAQDWIWRIPLQKTHSRTGRAQWHVPISLVSP